MRSSRPTALGRDTPFARCGSLPQRTNLVDVGRTTCHVYLAPRHTSSPATSALTAREAEVLGLLDEGRSNGEIGRALFISTKTASVHVSNILAKLGAASRGEAVALARAAGLLEQ